MANKTVDLVKEGKGFKIEFLLWPHFWQTYLSVHNWESRPLNRVNERHIPQAPGVYSLLLQPGIAGHKLCSNLMYIGEAKDLRVRFHDYLTRERKSVCV